MTSTSKTAKTRHTALGKRPCRHYRSESVKQYGDGWLRCLDCGKVRNTFHPNMKEPVLARTDQQATKEK